MNGNRFLADTNTFIYLLSRHPVLETLLETEWLFSFITEIELLGKPGIKQSEIKEVKDMLSVCTRIFHSDKINEIAISLKQRYRIKIPDALIAASALHLQIPLLTFDKGFKKITELDLVLPEA